MKENTRERAGQLTEVQIGKEDTGTLLVPDVFDWKVLAPRRQQCVLYAHVRCVCARGMCDIVQGTDVCWPHCRAHCEARGTTERQCRGVVFALRYERAHTAALQRHTPNNDNHIHSTPLT
jgi:hypothetical protein